MAETEFGRMRVKATVEIINVHQKEYHVIPRKAWFRPQKREFTQLKRKMDKNGPRDHAYSFHTFFAYEIAK